MPMTRAISWNCSRVNSRSATQTLFSPSHAVPWNTNILSNPSTFLTFT
jgi:hypothetical protein